MAEAVAKEKEAVKKKKKDKSGKSNKIKDIWNSFKQVLNEL